MAGVPVVEAQVQPRLRLALATLCVTEIVSWGVTYYAFPVLLSAITADTGWSASAASAAFSLGLLVSAVAGIPVGRWLDRFGPRKVMTVGSVLAVIAMIAVASATSLLTFALAWALAGIAMSGILYPPAFAAVTGWFGPDRMRGLLVLTLVAGLSSTVFAPLTAVLVENFSWRTSYMLLTVLLVGTVLLHGWGLRAPWNPTAPSRQSRAQVRHVVHSRGFIVLSVVFTTLALAFYMASLGLVPLLVERGFDHRLAATTLGLLGAGQLVGRLLYGPVVRSRSSTTGIVFVVVIAGGSILGLALLPPVVGVLITSAVVFGAARGAFTLLQASVVADRWGQQHYGAVAGVFAMPITTATAMAPWAAAAVTSLMGSNITTYLMTAAVLGLAGVLLRFSDLGGRH